MKKLSLLTLALFLLAGYSYAQDNITENLADGKLSASVDIGFAGGDFADFFNYGVGFGASANYEVEQSENVTFGGNLGFLIFSGDEFTFGGNNTDYESTLTNILVRVFGRYYLMPELYGEARAGYNIASFSGDGNVSVEPDPGATFGLGIGYVLNEKIDLGAGFDILAQDMNAFVISAGYRF